MRKSLSISLLLRFSLLTALLCTSAGFPKDSSLNWTKESPNRDIIITEYVKETAYQNYLHQIWLSPAGNAQSRVLLYEHGRSADVLMSDDERSLVVNDNLGSNIAEVKLFRRGKGLTFKEVNDVDISDLAWQFLAKTNGLKVPPGYDHTYVSAETWGANGKTILLKIEGHGDERDNLDPWFCIYNTETRTFSLDLRDLNKGSLHTSQVTPTPVLGKEKP